MSLAEASNSRHVVSCESPLVEPSPSASCWYEIRNVREHGFRALAQLPHKTVVELEVSSTH